MEAGKVWLLHDCDESGKGVINTFPHFMCFLLVPGASGATEIYCIGIDP